MVGKLPELWQCVCVFVCFGVAFCNLSIGAFWSIVYRRPVHVNQYQSAEQAHQADDAFHYNDIYVSVSI